MNSKKFFNVITLAEGVTHADIPNCQRKIAFTLAEVLVTLGIIGVVSAMTVPSLMNHYQRQTYVTQLHKVYTETSQAVMQYQADHNADNLYEAGLYSQASFNSFVPEYFKVVNRCTNTDDCFPAITTYKKMSGTALTAGAYTAQNSYVLASGAAVRFNYSAEGQKLCNIMVDVNGFKGPNILGRDLFTLALYRDGSIDDYGTSSPVSKDSRNSLFNNQCNGGGATEVWGCFGKILNEGWQMKY